MVSRYGEAESMEDFCNKMQLMNAAGYQGIFEAAGHKLNDIGGVMLWKLNAAFPSVVWQVYDWFLQTNAGYYFMQNACEPVHIQLNLNDLKVTVLNRKYKPAPNLTARIEVFNTESKSLFSEEAYFSLGPSEVKVTESLAQVREQNKGILFVVLNLKDSGGRVVSHNVYWLSADGNYKDLNNLPETSVTASLQKTSSGSNEDKYSVRVVNNSAKIAFFLRPQLTVGGEEVLPSYWSAGYFTLAPSESTTLSVSCPAALIEGKSPVLKVSGWNVPEQIVRLSNK
jgi:hypothetical protein